MRNILIRIITLTITIILVAYIFPDNMIRLEGEGWNMIWPALITALFLALVNLIVKPIVSILTIPINILTLGLFFFNDKCSNALDCRLLC